MPLGSKPDGEGTGGKTFHAKNARRAKLPPVGKRHILSLFSGSPGRGMHGNGLDLGRQLRLSVPHDDRPLAIHWTTCFLSGQRPRTCLRPCCTINEEQERRGFGRHLRKILVRQCMPPFRHGVLAFLAQPRGRRLARSHSERPVSRFWSAAW